jgi:3-hydroxybutyryl-CoA dehydrogenase
MFAEFTGRPEKFLALHFANPVWKANIAEIMGHQGTSKEVFDIVVDFARSIGLVPIPIYKEQPGYVLNSLLVPWLTAAETLYFDGVADFKSIDKTWMISTGSPIGPFGIIDIIGMQTLYNVIMLRYKQTGDESFLRRAKIIKEQYIDKGKLGIAAGEGFYKYPNPEYQRPDFLKK